MSVNLEQVRDFCRLIGCEMPPNLRADGRMSTSDACLAILAAEHAHLRRQVGGLTSQMHSVAKVLDVITEDRGNGYRKIP